MIIVITKNHNRSDKRVLRGSPPLIPLLGGSRWQALLGSRIGQRFKDLVEIIEEELVHLEEVSEA